jgi:hypothetical protein
VAAALAARLVGGLPGAIPIGPAAALGPLAALAANQAARAKRGAEPEPDGKAKVTSFGLEEFRAKVQEAVGGKGDVAGQQLEVQRKHVGISEQMNKALQEQVRQFDQFLKAQQRAFDRRLHAEWVLN